jgi:NDP-sugar pyrophosphorylase family protein
LPVDRAVILAGGLGSRLLPYTTVLPKPLLPVGDRAILDIVVHQLAAAGVGHMTISTGHLAHLVRAVFGDGSAYGVRLDYAEEDEPLGTAGPMREIEGLDSTFLALNGDILTTLDIRELVRAHHEAGNALTIAGTRRTVRADYGVMLLDGDGDGPTTRLHGYDEKPETSHVVSMGIYVVEPRAVEHVPAEGRFDIPDLVLALLAAGEPVGTLLHDGYWRDIGRHDDYEQAIADFEELRPRLFSGG